MQFRPEAASGPGYSVRRPGAPPFPAGPPFRGGFPVDHGPRVDDRRHHVSRTHSASQRPEDEDAPASRHLWVGNVSQDVSEDVLTEKFSKYGEIEGVTVYSQRNYAFINFMKEEDAVDAKNGLQGVNLGGLAMRIEFAKGAKPSRHPWVGGIGQTVSKEDFEEYARLEDAVAAVDAVNRKRLGDEELRVDYVRSQPLKREAALSGNRHQGEERIVSRDHRAGFGSGLGSTSGAKDKDGEPSEVLWVGFPLYAKVDEEGLRRAFVPFGEIERIKTFPGRTYAFVQFRSVEEATRAKDGLEGKLFDDPRVHIRYSKSEIGPVDNPRDIIESPGTRYSEPPVKGVGPTRFTIGGVDRLGAGSPVRPSSPGMRISSLRPEVLTGNPVGRGVVSSRTVGLGPGMSLGRGMGRGDGRMIMDEMEFQMAGQAARVGVSSSGLRAGGRHSYEDAWDLPDEDLASREQKRARVGVYSVGASGEASSFDNFNGRRFAGIEGVNLGSTTDLGSAGYGVARQGVLAGDDYALSGSRARLNLQLEVSRPAGMLPHATSVGSGYLAGGKRELHGQESGTGPVNESWGWHGTIAKGGTPVCRARCFPVGKGIDANVPDVVNCTARTDLDMLAKHVYQAGDFGVVFFVPEADPDVPPYQDFMHYLGEKRRAGVAKLGDGTTLFLVPPSEFSEKVLKVPGNDCLFGVVLKQPHVVLAQPSQPQQQQASVQQPSQPSTHQQFSQAVGPAVVPGPVQDAPPGFRGPSPPLIPGHQSGQGPSAGPNTASQAPLGNLAGLTPELIASLTALLPQQAHNNPVTSNSAPGQAVAVSAQFSQSGTVTAGRGPSAMPQGPLLTSSSGVNDPRPAFRPTQSPASQGWHQLHQEQNQPSPASGGVTHHSTGLQALPEIYQAGAAQQQHQQQQTPLAQQQSSPQQPGIPQVSSSSIHNVQSQEFPLPGFSGQYLQQSRPPQSSSAPQLPAEQLAQLTALLTQRQQQPAQQQAAHLLQQHFQQQQPTATSTSQQLPQTVQSHVAQQGQVQQVHSSQPLQPPAVGATSQSQWGQQQHALQSQQQQGQRPNQTQHWDGAEPQVQQIRSLTPAEQQAAPSQVSTGGEEEVEKQKRFEATLQLAAALLQQMQQQDKPRGGQEQQ